VNFTSLAWDQTSDILLTGRWSVAWNIIVMDVKKFSSILEYLRRTSGGLFRICCHCFTFHL